MASDISLATGEGYIIGAEELESLYLVLENSIPELKWQNPGRIIEEESKGGTENLISESLDIQEPAKNDFDFSDFDSFGPQARSSSTLPTRGNTPKSAKKKTANFADVLRRIKNPTN